MSSIRKVVINGFFWSIINQFSTTLVGLVLSGILSRLITPAEFGIVGMVALAIGFLNVIKDFGFGAALVQKKNVSDEEYSTVFWVNLIIGLGLTVVVFALAPFVAEFFKEERVEQVTKVLSFTFIINAIGIIWSNKMLKDVAFKQIFYRSFISTLISGVVAIVLAFKGFGLWAIVCQTYVSLLSSTFLNYLQVRWLPMWTMKKVYIKELYRFGLPLLADQVVNYWARNIDSLLVGRALGKESLAYYNKAYSLMLLPVKQITNSLTKVLFPSFSLIQDDKAKIAAIYLSISGVVAFVAFPMMTCLSLLAEPLILIVYGENWRPVIPIFKVLSILGMFQALATLSGNIYLSLGKTKLMFQVGLFSRGVIILGLVTGLYLNGIMGMVYGYCVASGIAFFPELYYISKLIEVKLTHIILNFIPYFLIASLCYVVIWRLFITFQAPLLLNFLVQLGCFNLLYLLINIVLKTRAYVAVLDLIRRELESSSLK